MGQKKAMGGQKKGSIEVAKKERRYGSIEVAINIKMESEQIEETKVANKGAKKGETEGSIKGEKEADIKVAKEGEN